MLRRLRLLVTADLVKGAVGAIGGEFGGGLVGGDFFCDDRSDDRCQ